MLSCLQLPEGLEHNALLYRFFIGSRFFFFAATRLTHSQGFGFSRLACRERSERNAKREKTYIIFAGGTDAKIIKSISEGNTACSLFTGGTEVNNQQSISEGNTLLCLFSNLIYKKNDNRYERVQKIDPRNTLRGMKTKETIFLK